MKIFIILGIILLSILFILFIGVCIFIIIVVREMFYSKDVDLELYYKMTPEQYQYYNKIMNGDFNLP